MRSMYLASKAELHLLQGDAQKCITLLEPLIDLDQHVIVAGILLHRLGRAKMMHQHDRKLRLRDDRCGTRIISQGRYVVDHPCPGGQ